MSIGWFARTGADFMWRAGAAPCQVAFLLPSGSTQQTTDPRGQPGPVPSGVAAGGVEAERAGTPFSSTGPISVNVTDPPSACRLRRSCVMSVSSEADPEGSGVGVGRGCGGAARQLGDCIRRSGLGTSLMRRPLQAPMVMPPSRGSLWSATTRLDRAPSRRRRTVAFPGPSEPGRPVRGLERS